MTLCLKLAYLWMLADNVYHMIVFWYGCTEYASAPSLVVIVLPDGKGSVRCEVHNVLKSLMHVKSNHSRIENEVNSAIADKYNIYDK